MIIESKKLNELTLDELLIRKRKLKAATIGLGIVMFAAFAILIYLATKNNNFALISVGICSLIGLVPLVVANIELEKEIKSRTSK